MANIKVIKYDASTDRLREIYDDLIQSRGKLADVHTIQSLRPESIVKHIDLYLEIMFTKSDLSRADREMIAVIVSAANNCSYCQIHHITALNHYWKDDSKVEQLKKDYRKIDLTKRQSSLCEYAVLLTKNPEIANTKDITMLLRDNGLSDSAILDASLVVSYFNFVNRMVLSLGLDSKADDSKGYNY